MALSTKSLDPDVRLYVLRELESRDDQVNVTCVSMALVYHLAMAGAASYIYSSPVASAMLPLHATTIIGCLVALLIHFRYQSVSRLTPFSQSAIIAYHGFVLAWVDVTEQDRILLFWIANMLLYFALRTHVANPVLLLVPILVGVSSGFFSAWGAE
jgi:hypothetical protein